MTGRLATLAVIGTITATALSGCGTTEVTADSACGEYLDIPSPLRHDVAVRLSSELGAAHAGSPMIGMDLDYYCGSSRETKLSAYFDRER